MANATVAVEMDLHPMFIDMLKRDDGWRSEDNVSSLDYNFMTRHPAMSIVFLVITTTAAVLGNIGNILVSLIAWMTHVLTLSVRSISVSLFHSLIPGLNLSFTCIYNN